MSMQGPNVKKLIAHRASSLMIPPGSCQGRGEALAHVVSQLTDKANLIEKIMEAAKWVEDALSLVKSFPDNPHGDDDEAIAGEVLRKIEEANAKRRAT